MRVRLSTTAIFGDLSGYLMVVTYCTAIAPRPCNCRPMLRRGLEVVGLIIIIIIIIIITSETSEIRPAVLHDDMLPSVSLRKIAK